MKKFGHFISMFVFFPCSLFLTSQPLSVTKFLGIYERIVFEMGADWISDSELNEIYNGGLHEPESLFKLSASGHSEREPIRLGLEQLRLLIGRELDNVAPEILKSLEQRLKLNARLVKSLDREIAKSVVALSEVEFIKDVNDFSRAAYSQNLDFFAFQKGDSVFIRSFTTSKIVETISLPHDIRFVQKFEFLGGGTKLVVTFSNFQGIRAALYDIVLKTWLRLDFLGDADTLKVSPKGDYFFVQKTISSLTYIYHVATGKVLVLDRSRSPASNSLWKWIYFSGEKLVATYLGRRSEYFAPATGLGSGGVPVTEYFDAEAQFETSPDGAFLFSWHGDHAKIWKSESMTLHQPALKISPYYKQSEFSKDNSLVAITCAQEVLLWNVAAKKEQQRWRPRTEDHTFNSASISPDNRFVVIIAAKNPDLNREIILYDAQTGDEVSRFNNVVSSFGRVFFSPDGRTLYTSDNGGTLFIWNLPRVIAERSWGE